MRFNGEHPIVFGIFIQTSVWTSDSFHFSFRDRRLRFEGISVVSFSQVERKRWVFQKSCWSWFRLWLICVFWVFHFTLVLLSIMGCFDELYWMFIHFLCCGLRKKNDVFQLYISFHKSWKLVTLDCCIRLSIFFCWIVLSSNICLNSPSLIFRVFKFETIEYIIQTRLNGTFILACFGLQEVSSKYCLESVSLLLM